MVTVTIVQTNGYIPEKVLLAAPSGAEMDDSPPFAFSIVIPEEKIGEIPLIAFGVDSNGTYAVSQEVVLLSSTSATITNLTMDPPNLFLFDYSSEQQLWVTGWYSDGIQRELNPESMEISFSVENPSVVSVHTNGLVFAGLEGVTTVTAVYESLTAMSSVEVVRSPLRTALAIEHLGDDLQLRWFGRSGISYQLQSSTNLPNWTNAETSIPGNGDWNTNALSGQSTAEAAQIFYRLSADKSP